MNRAGSVRLSLATRAQRRRPLISLTPLIDVVCVLVIFFMVLTEFIRETGLKIDLPEATGETQEMPGTVHHEIWC